MDSPRIAWEPCLQQQLLKTGRSFPHGPFQELINGAKMALNYLLTFPTTAICGGVLSIIPHI